MVEDNARKLSKADGLAELKKVRSEYTRFYTEIAKAFSDDSVITELMQARGYNTPEMFATLKEVGITKVSYLSELELIRPLSEYETVSKWGIIDKNGNYLLSNRYVVPIRDMVGNVTALVGWYPDERKYVTTPTFGFSKSAQFFNIEDYKRHIGEPVYLVEGIFDTLSLRSQNLFALGNMGLNLSSFKREILTRFGHIFAIPDNDKAGKGVLPYKNRNSKNKWDIQNNVTFVELSIPDIKDVDDLIKTYDCVDDLKNLSTNLTVKLKT